MVVEEAKPGWKKYVVSIGIIFSAGLILWATVDVSKVGSIMRSADLGLYFLALFLFYIPFWFRGERWLLLLRSAGVNTSRREATESLFMSFVANNIIPAQLGDVYRAHLLGVREQSSRSCIMGTVLTDRIFDLLFLIVAVPTIGWVVAGDLLFPSLSIGWKSSIIIIGIVVGGIGVVLKYGNVILPNAVWGRVKRMHAGVIDSLSFDDMPAIVSWTVMIWGFVGIRVYTVAESVGASLTLGTSIFLAYFMILVTILPLTPAGLGMVEMVSTGVLHLLGVETAVALSIVLLDRTITYVSLIIVGAVAALLTDRSLF